MINHYNLCPFKWLIFRSTSLHLKSISFSLSSLYLLSVVRGLHSNGALQWKMVICNHFIISTKCKPNNRMCMSGSHQFSVRREGRGGGIMKAKLQPFKSQFRMVRSHHWVCLAAMQQTTKLYVVRESSIDATNQCTPYRLRELCETFRLLLLSYRCANTQSSFSALCLRLLFIFHPQSNGYIDVFDGQTLHSTWHDMVYIVHPVHACSIHSFHSANELNSELTEQMAFGAKNVDWANGQGHGNEKKQILCTSHSPFYPPTKPKHTIADKRTQKINCTRYYLWRDRGVCMHRQICARRQ